MNCNISASHTEDQVEALAQALETAQPHDEFGLGHYWVQVQEDGSLLVGDYYSDEAPTEMWPAEAVAFLRNNAIPLWGVITPKMKTAMSRKIARLMRPHNMDAHGIDRLRWLCVDLNLRLTDDGAIEDEYNDVVVMLIPNTQERVYMPQRPPVVRQEPNTYRFVWLRNKLLRRYA